MVVGRCRTPSGRFSGGIGGSSFFFGLPLLLVACSLELLEYKVRRKHLKCSGWLERHLRIGHGENIDIFKKLFVVDIDRVQSHDPNNHSVYC